MVTSLQRSGNECDEPRQSDEECGSRNRIGKPRNEPFPLCGADLQNEGRDEVKPDRKDEPLLTEVDRSPQEHRDSAHERQNPGDHQSRNMQWRGRWRLRHRTFTHTPIMANLTLDRLMGMLDEILQASEAVDGFPAVSDQARREARTGERTIITRGDDPANPRAVGIVGNGELDLVVHPDARGKGLGRALLTELLAEAGPGELRAWVHDDGPRARHLMESSGFTPVRTLLRLELPGTAIRTHRDHVATVESSAPEGIRIRTFTDADAEALVEVNGLAFASHPEQGALTVENFWETSREPWFNRDDILIAEDPAQNRVLGFSWIKTTRNPQGETETELYVIGVHPDAAGRGLGTALLSATLTRMSDHDPVRATLYVEGDNTPALALYFRVGFTTAMKSQQWLKTT